jgi:hypothetical protein
VRYYKRPWEEDRGDEYASWGTSFWYFEVDERWEVVRPLEVYASGAVLAYDSSHPEDRDGMPAESALPSDEMAPFEIPKQEFDRIWQSSSPLNRTEPRASEGLGSN